MNEFKKFNTPVLTFDQIDSLTDVGIGIVDMKKLNCSRNGYKAAISMFDIVRSNNYHVYFCAYDQIPELLSKEQYRDTEELLYNYCKRLVPMIESCEKLSQEGVEKYPGELLEKAHEFFQSFNYDQLDRKTRIAEVSDYCLTETRNTIDTMTVVNEYYSHEISCGTYLQSFAIDAINFYVRLKALSTVRSCLRAKNLNHRGVTDIMRTLIDRDVVFERHYHGYKLMQYMHKWDIDP